MDKSFRTDFCCLLALYATTSSIPFSSGMNTSHTALPAWNGIYHTNNLIVYMVTQLESVKNTSTQEDPRPLCQSKGSFQDLPQLNWKGRDKNKLWRLQSTGMFNYDKISKNYPKWNSDEKSKTKPDGKRSFRGSSVGAVVRALAFHECGPGSIPGSDVICGLLREVVPRVLRFSPLTKYQHLSWFDFCWFDFLSHQLVEPLCSAQYTWNINKVIISIIIIIY